MPGSASDNATWSDLQDYDDWIETASDEDIRENSQSNYNLWDELIQEWQETFNPKTPWEQIAEDVESLEEDPDFSWAKGPISYGWLAERINCSLFELPEDLPYHAKVGAGHQALGFAIEEDFLLRDAILFLVMAQHEYKMLIEAIERAEKSNRSIDEIFEIYNKHSENVATYSRITVFSLYAFIECFVNSICEDFLARNRGVTLEKNDMDNLKGFRIKDNGKINYFQIQKRMEKIPGIIRGDKKCHLLLSDRAQRTEPFVSFFGSLKEIRDSTTHHAKTKADIIRDPEKWMEIIDNACDTCLEVARLFWIACYPDRPNPIYLDGLDKVKYINAAENRYIVQRYVE